MVYKNAPIREAVFDVRIDKLDIETVEQLASFKDKIIGDFPIEKKKYNVTGSFNFADESIVEKSTNRQLLGYIFLSNDGTRQIQARSDGFTFNVLKPYDNWEVHFEVFVKNWIEYSNLFKPSKILRIATRYINRIELPLPFKTFHEYILNTPPIPSCLPQAFSNFFMQIQVPHSDNYRRVIITETIEPPVDSKLPFILDIDVFQEEGIENLEEKLRSEFYNIRQIKNQIFECCITDKARELFQ